MCVQCLCLCNVKFHYMAFTCILQERRAVTNNLVTPFLSYMYIFPMTSQGLKRNIHRVSMTFQIITQLLAITCQADLAS